MAISFSRSFARFPGWTFRTYDEQTAFLEAPETGPKIGAASAFTPARRGSLPGSDEMTSPPHKTRTRYFVVAAGLVNCNLRV